MGAECMCLRINSNTYSFLVLGSGVLSGGVFINVGVMP
jgi:hypothetical protein